MWFITGVHSESGNTRRFGFFKEFKDANDAIAQNRGEMHEYLYDFLILEEIDSEQIFPNVKQEYWFKWFNDPPGWSSYNESALPNDLGVCTNYAIG